MDWHPTFKSHVQHGLLAEVALVLGGCEGGWVGGASVTDGEEPMLVGGEEGGALLLE